MHKGRMRKLGERRHTDLSRMTVRMRETSVVAGQYNEVLPLLAGKEYALPKEYAHYLVVTGKANYVSGRLDKRFPKDVRAPVRKQRISFAELVRKNY